MASKGPPRAAENAEAVRCAAHGPLAATTRHALGGRAVGCRRFLVN